MQADSLGWFPSQSATDIRCAAAFLIRRGHA